MPRVSNAFTHKLNKTINKKQTDNKFFTMLKRISINVHSSTQQITLQIWCLLKVRTGWLYSLINLDFFLCFR